MAPSVQSSNVPSGKRQSDLRTYARVSKAATFLPDIKASEKQAVAPIHNLHSSQPSAGENRKAKRRHVDDSDDDDSVKTPGQPLSRAKKPKLQLATPPSSSQSGSDSDASPISLPSLYSLNLASTPKGYVVPPRASTPKELPQTLQEFISMHSIFLKALSLHYAHNGSSTPAELSALLKTVTCLWKKRRVVKVDIQQMLALYEISEDSSVLLQASIEHKASPFKLTTSGTGLFVRTCIEYIGGSSPFGSSGLMHAPFNEKCLQTLFKADLMCLYLSSRSNPALQFLNGPLKDFPLLSCSIGAQTVARHEIASARRSEILSLSAQAQQKSQPKPQNALCETTEEHTETQIAEKVKSRTQSLFDRVKAKQLANSSNTTPTADTIRRRHAIGRIAEVVEILRMKQQQKMSANFVSAVHISPSKIRNKVSFSLSQLTSEIKNSVSVPVGDEEVRMCLKMLAGEVSGFWVSMFEMGSGESKITSVVLNGQGMSGKEAQRLVQEKEHNG